MKTNPTPSTCSASQASLSARLGLAWVLVVAWLAPAAQGSNTFTNTGPLAMARVSHTATLLPNGQVLVAGGAGPAFGSAELYDVGLGFSGAWQPQITSASFTPGGQLVLSGTGFRGISSASGSNSSQDSTTSYPMVQFRRLDNEQSAFLLSDPAVSVSDTSFIWAALRSFPIANGIPSASGAVLLSTVDQPPTISDIPDQIINEDSSTAALTFDVSDAETPAAALDVTGASSDTTLIPNANIVLSGTGSSRVVMVSPAADQFGSATITLSVDDGNGGTANTSFVVTVNSVNDLPTITPIADLAITSGTSSPAIPFTIGDVETPAGVLIVTATSSNPGLVTVSNITFGGTGANRSVAITPAANQVGSAVIDLNVTDTNSGNATVSFTVNATPSSPSVIFGPIINPANSNTFFLLDLSSWSAAETVATSIGGHLVTIRNQSEQDWVYNTFGNIGGIARNLWIGLYDPDPINNATDPVARMDEFVWSSGEPVGYSTWTPGEPNNFNGTGEFFVQMWNPGTGASSLWNDNLDNPSSNQPGSPWNGVVELTQQPVNDAPSFAKGADQTVLEDAGPQTVTGWATAITAGPPDELAQVWTFIVTNTNNALFSVQPDIDTSGTLTYTPALNANGIALVTVTLHDNGGTANGGVDSSAPQNLSITVNPVNDPPSFTKGADQTVNEDAGSQTVAGWAAGISAGPLDESGQAVNFSVSNNNNALFSAQPAIDGAGTLTYTPAANANGIALVTVTLHDNGGTANGGVDTSAPQTLSITVNPVNDPPSFTKGADQTVNEDAGSQTLAGWATGISAGPPDESWQALNFSINNDNNALFSVQPAIDGAGTLTYTPAANTKGSAFVNLILHDNGGTANGGIDSSAPQTLSITVNPVNDAPSFTKGADQTVNEDAVTQTVAGWASGINAGPPDESGQALNFSVSNNNSALFSAQPAIDGAGTLTYTPAANANGSAIVTLILHDNVGTANGGVDSSAPHTLSITVNTVNDAPSFTKSVDQTVNENAGSQTVAGWASGINAGPPDESWQALNFSVSNNNNALFSAQPAIDGAGTLTYTPAPNANGSAIITLILQDNGGTANGGVDSSAPQTLGITVNPVNHPPSFSKGADQTVNEDAGSQTVTGWATGISAGPPDESGQALNFLVSNNNNALFSAQPAIDGAGTLTYTPAPNTNGSATVTVSLQDNGGNANGGVDSSAPQTLSITVNPVNDPPSFTKGADQTVNEDAGSQTVTGWATGISAGPPDEAGQALSFSVSNNNNLLFSVQPAISAVGTLTYTPAPNTNGSATVTVSLQDNGGTANGGVDTSAAQALIITVNPTNHPPSLAAISGQSTAMGQPTLPIQLRLDDPDAGDVDRLTLEGKSSNAGLVSDVGGFAFEGSGRNWLLTVTPQPGQTGMAVLTVTVQDPAGATSSVGFQLDVYSGPQILTQPIGWTVDVGSRVSLDVLAKSTPESELTYEWYKDNNPVAGAASSSLLFTNAQLADSGRYHVVVTSPLGQVTSNPAQFTARLPSRPVVGAPTTDWNAQDRTLKLRVDASGEEPLSYQWLRNGVALADGPATTTPPLLERGAVAGATTKELTITNFRTADAGLFSVRVGNPVAVVESSTLLIGISEVTPQAGDLPVSDNLPDAAYLQDPRNWLTTDQSLGKANTRGFKNEPPDEPQHAGRPGGSSGWFLWKAEARGVAAFASAGSAFDTLLAVYRQADPAKPLTFANLVTVASDDDGGGFLTSYVRFNAEREVLYLIAFDDRTGQGGDAVLSWQFTRDVTAPVIKTQPVSLAVHANDPPGQLSVTLEDSQDDRFTFVWFRNGVPLQEGVEGFGGVRTRTLTLVGWNEEKVALYTVAITSNQSGLSVESDPAIVELISGDASANYTARSKLADAFVPTRPPAGPGLAASLQRSGRRGIGLLTTGASAGTIITTGKGEGSIPPEGCGLEADTVWRVATDLGFPPKAYVVMEAEANKLPFNLSLWTSDCTLADLNDLSCLHAQNWNCVTVTNGNVARLEFASSPDLQYIIAINGVGGADGRVKLSWQTEVLRSSITFKDGGWVVIDTGANPGLKGVEHVSVSSQPDSNNPNLKVESNAAATRFWFPVLTGTNYAIKLNPDSYPYEKLVYTTKAGHPNIEVAAAGSSGRKLRLSWSGEGVSLRSTTDLTATWQSNSDLEPTISGENRELNLTPGQTPAIFFLLVPDP